MVVKKAELAVLVEDSASPDKPNLSAKHGLSFFVKAKTSDGEVSLMMDTGPSPDVLFNNVEMMSIDLRKTEVVMLSHAHYDHTGGLIEVLKLMEKGVPVVAHPKIFDPKFKVRPSLKSIGASFRPSDIEAAGGMPLLAVNPVELSQGIMASGEVERKATFEKAEGFWTVNNGRFVEDMMPDDQSLIINIEGKGLVIVAGCAHSGIINTIEHAQKISETKRVFAVLGGFHLARADEKRIQTTVTELTKLDLSFIGPCHCTGSKAVNKIAEALGDRCRRLHTGDIVRL
jgi:7,8-dihydropterin-6-yl-methyl-4-(beta-D-ribofuranosyl)aminobenzene 5'-phosphate synthase